ncbi:mucin-2-like isoform X2 [Anopheles albimanus]|uniref:mucin-2-like isoform X2 n=1 Tax=Anopheles albimanus TaxID=7167 RepID=UPI00163E8227|nr:mucin-2-like isoform X2 [Anopheles albimanus]
MMQTLVAIAIVVLLLVQTLAGATGVPVEEPLPVGERVTRNVVCEKVGRLPDYASTDCKTYYVCTPNTQGSLIAILSQCPSSSLFSLEQLKCVPSADYSCPLTTIEAEQTTTTIPSTTTTMATTTKTPEPGFICPAAGRFANPQSFDCGSYYLCTRNTDGSLIAIVVTCPGTSIFDPELAACVLAPHFCAQATVPTTETTIVTPGSTVGDGFVCPDEGRYADLESSDCSRYYMCLKSGGAIVATPAVCPLSTIFSPIVRQCVDKSTYACPSPTPAPTTRPPFPTTTTPVVIPTTTTPVAPVTTTVVTPRPTIPIIVPTTTTSRPVITTEVTTLPTEAQTITVEVPTTTTPAPVTTTEVTPQPTIPIIVPTTTTSKPITTTEVTTPSTEAQTITVEVPTTTTPAPVTTTEVTPQPTIPIIVPTTAITTEVPTTTEEEVTSTTSVEVTTAEIDTTPEATSASTTEVTFPETTTTDAGSTEPTEQPTETEPTSTTAATSETTVTDTFESTTEFSESTTEQTEEVTTTDTPTITNVEQTTVSEPSTTSETTTIEAESTTQEQSTSEELTTTDIDISTSAELTTTEPPTTISSTTTDASPDIFICPDEGRYPDPKAVACESYILCIINTLGTLTPLTFECPPTTIFSLIMKMCVPATTYNCGATPTDPAPTVPTSTVSSTTEPGPIVTPRPFVCPAPGRYTNPESIYCKTYYLCLYNAFGILDAVELSCPAGSIFAREVSRCEPDTEYECVTSPVFTTTETSVSTETTTTTEYPSSVTTVPTTVTVTPSPSTTTAPFQCTESGRYANAETTDCKTYKYCISVEGGFAQYTFTCPIGALFDADARVCSDTYVCPSNTEPFVCTGPGKFVNRDRNDCKTYKYCIAMVDGFTQHTFSCPNGALFDANTRLCSPTYICPLL